MILCTVGCSNHLPLAMVMAQSVKRVALNFKVVLCLVEEEVHPLVQDCVYFDQIILAKDLEIPNFNQFAFKYNRYEATCAVKPYLLLHLVNQYPSENKFIYLDSDISVYSVFDEVITMLDTYSIIITPHLTEPHDINHYEEIARLRDGTFNGGFLAINRSSETDRFLKWWANRNYYHCYIDYKEGLFLDQKWLELIPCYFNNYHILTHPGYNIANWNYRNRQMLKTTTGNYLVNDQPLRFIHFSGLENIYLPDKTEPFCIFRDQFVTEIKEKGYDTFIDEPWSYDYFSSGEFIKPRTKTKYRKSQEIQNIMPTPFNESNNSIKLLNQRLRGE